jgi:hypothetical protein
VPDDSRRWPALALATIVIVFAIVYGAAAQAVSTPRVHPDEHIYAGGAASLAESDGLRLRGEPYELGPVLPGLLATILVLAGDRETAYPFYKIVNALLFALAALPIYLVARRLLQPWWSVGVAAFSIAIPSSMYVALVMTESASFLLFATALLAIVLAVERPSVLRQLAVLGVVGIAYSTRAQFAVLLPAFLAAIAGTWALAPDRERIRSLAGALWPTLTALALGVVILVVRPLATGSSPLDVIGAYEVLFRGYNPLDIGKWVAYHIADLEIYLAVVPIAVSPIVLSLLWRRGREGSRRSAAFLTAFVSVNASMLLVTAAFASTEFGFDRLHDRNVFYLAPLWLVVLGVWLAEGLPRPRIAAACGAVLALGLVALLPFRYVSSDVGVDVVPSAVWARLNELLAGEIVTARKLLVLGLVSLVVLVLLVPRRLWWILPAVMIISFSATAALAWERIVDATENAVFEGAPERRWVDALVPEDAAVTKVYLVTTECPASAVTWHALYLTEFFNRSLARAAYIDDSVPDGLPSRRVDVAPDGRLVDGEGAPLEATYVLTQPGLTLQGEVLGRGTSADLVLWRADGPVRIVGARSNEDLRTVDCA